MSTIKNFANKTAEGKVKTPKHKKGRSLINPIDPDEVARIERSSPFIKNPGFIQKASEDDNAREKLLSNMKLTDLRIDYNDKVGEGAYGNVYLAKHLPTGFNLAVKKLQKS